jgi:5-methylcytosine-specific restriction endonuclease McrA
MSKRSKACDISQKVKKAVWDRDKHCCIICGNPYAMPNAHYIGRAQGGLGIEQNVVTLCMNCHNKYDNGDSRASIGYKIQWYLKSCYENWNEENLIYRKW